MIDDFNLLFNENAGDHESCSLHRQAGQIVSEAQDRLSIEIGQHKIGGGSSSCGRSSNVPHDVDLIVQSILGDIFFRTIDRDRINLNTDNGRRTKFGRSHG